MGTIGLARALALLRDELSQAQDDGAGHQLRFEITEAEAEFVVEVITEGGLEGKANFGVVSLGADGKVSTTGTHRLRLRLSVKDDATGGRNLEVHRQQNRRWD